jgi:hypothetical protein
MEYGTPEWPEICWIIPLQPGMYLIDLSMGEGKNEVTYSWVFQITHPPPH